MAFANNPVIPLYRRGSYPAWPCGIEDRGLGNCWIPGNERGDGNISEDGYCNCWANDEGYEGQGEPIG